ncbi:MAG: hypothetical protein H6727_02005 [Myxococcales bacterium]|nr:hypothetical protein [Myxococcales bacterium]
MSDKKAATDPQKTEETSQEASKDAALNEESSSKEPTEAAEAMEASEQEEVSTEVSEPSDAQDAAEHAEEKPALKPVYFPWQAGGDKEPEAPLSEEQIQLKKMQRLGRLAVLVCFGLFSGAVVISIFVSVYRAVHAPPKVWIPLEKTGSKGYVMKARRLRTCASRLRSLDLEMETESKNLWFRVRRGNRYYLTAWKDWSRDWQRRMNILLTQCPLRGNDEVSLAFRRASTRMLELHKRQEKVFSKFFGEAAWLFREVREGLHILQEELRQ